MYAANEACSEGGGEGVGQRNIQLPSAQIYNRLRFTFSLRIGRFWLRKEEEDCHNDETENGSQGPDHPHRKVTTSAITINEMRHTLADNVGEMGTPKPKAARRLRVCRRMISTTLWSWAKTWLSNRRPLHAHWKQIGSVRCRLALAQTWQESDPGHLPRNDSRAFNAGSEWDYMHVGSFRKSWSWGKHAGIGPDCCPSSFHLSAPQAKNFQSFIHVDIFTRWCRYPSTWRPGYWYRRGPTRG